MHQKEATKNAKLRSEQTYVGEDIVHPPTPLASRPLQTSSTIDKEDECFVAHFSPFSNKRNFASIIRNQTLSSKLPSAAPTRRTAKAPDRNFPPRWADHCGPISTVRKKESYAIALITKWLLLPQLQATVLRYNKGADVGGQRKSDEAC